MTLEEAREHVGLEVVYTHGYRQPEAGSITGILDQYALFRRAGSSHATAVDPARLSPIPENVRRFPAVR